MEKQDQKTAISIRWILTSLRQGNVVTPKEAIRLLQENHHLPFDLSQDDYNGLLELLKELLNKKFTVNAVSEEIKSLRKNLIA